jgi:anti-sigma regulatory factor (Ser/Thr protein kinase)
VQEAIKNQHEHTHKKDKERKILIDLKVSKIEPHYAEISVRADGAVIDFAKVDEAAKILDPDAPYMGDRTRGLGMIRELCDEAYIHSKGPRTEHRLIKYKQAQQAGKEAQKASNF